MPMQAHEIETLLRESFPNATIQVSGDDGVHMAAMVIDESFRGMNRVQQQRDDVVLFMKGTPTSRNAASPPASCRCWTTSACRMPDVNVLQSDDRSATASRNFPTGRPSRSST
jgi:hypothetical protein